MVLTARVFDTTRSSGARLNAYRIDDTFYLDIDLPGVEPASIDVAEDGSTLTVRAERTHADLIVMTTHGRGPLERLWLGSVADDLLRNPGPPLLLVRPTEVAIDWNQNC